MTEKQGGSDVRTNTTRAWPLGAGGSGEAYELVGHKWFLSAPMCDAFLMLAQAPGGLSCFLVPRWRPDGARNPLQVQRLKNKLGNVANASNEIELRGALGWLVGEEGRGVRAILAMVALTRFDCMIGSSAGQRQAVVQAVHHAAHRSAFGRPLIAQPLMRNVLADLHLEVEGSLALTLRMARALEGHAKVAWVRHPFLPSHPDHALARRLLAGGGGVLSFSVRGGFEAVARVHDALRIVARASSLGGVESLASIPVISSHRHASDDDLAAQGIDRGTLRVSVGLEDPDALVADLLQALERA